jgi:hypothetical protein
MFRPEDIPADVPDEVKIVLAHLEPEPEVLAEERQRLLAELDARILSSQGTLQQLLEKMRAVLLSRQPGTAFQPRFAAAFAEALDHYGKDPAAPKPLPNVLHECLAYLREHLQATGMAPLLAAVEEDSLAASAAERVRQQEELRRRITRGSIRG